MAITIVVEDGSIVANANAYISVSDVRAFASVRGVDLGDDDDVIAAFIIKATDFIEANAASFQGCIVDPSQELSWPRNGVFLNDSELPFSDTAIPKNLRTATSLLVIAQNDGIVLQPNIQATDFVLKETVGPITTEYANPIQIGIAVQFTGVDSLLFPLYGNAGTVGMLRTIRV